MTFYHTPVLLHEVIADVNIRSGMRIIDATLGGGGYAWEIIRNGGVLLGIDADQDAIAYTKEALREKSVELRIKENWKIVQGNFRDIGTIAKNNGFETVDGIVFDLGVSSHQLDTPHKGFSYRFADAPLDMRLGANQKRTAAMLVNSATEEELYEIFATYSEEQRARTIAHALVRSRRIKPIETTGDLVSGIQSLPGTTAPGVLSRIFQGLRIAVNDEMSALKDALAQSISLLAPGGRIAVVTFHSLEDRIVKRMFLDPSLTLVTKKPIRPSEIEQQENPRSRSAKLRVAMKI